MYRDFITERTSLLCKSDIKERGWTEGMITRFLAAPDAIKPNPHYKCAAPMKLYDRERVLRIEETEPFKVAMEQSERRRLSSKKAVRSRVMRLLDYVESIEITVPKMSVDILRKKAITHYNYRQYDRGNHDFCANEDSDKDFLDRITVNYLRHEMTNYEQELRAIFGKAGKQQAYALLKKKVLDEIAEVYPSLRTECAWQASTITEAA